MNSSNENQIPSSFRDPSGFVFALNGKFYRQIHISYANNYDHLNNSGLYAELVSNELLIPHKEVANMSGGSPGVYKVIEPEIIPFISYPYEWCFSQLKHAALAVLAIQKQALRFGMSLKDASAYNIQFYNGKPILIDTLSFEILKEGTPWAAYRQFCQHFLAPLALMSFCDIRLSQLLKVFLDGVPLDLASTLLPSRSWLRFSLLTHIHLHAKTQKKFSNTSSLNQSNNFGKLSFLGLIDSLETAINDLKWNVDKSAWSHYYQETNYSHESFEQKKQVISTFLQKFKPRSLWDLGSNTGIFSRLACELKIETVSFDYDYSSVEINYHEARTKQESNLLPLCLDLTNPSPGVGWENLERMTLKERGPVDTVLALALIHHLAIVNNTPFSKIAHYFSHLGRTLIIEFVPKTDTQVQRLLASREDIFATYSKDNFENEFSEYFVIEDAVHLTSSSRIIYAMRRKHNA